MKRTSETLETYTCNMPIAGGGDEDRCDGDGDGLGVPSPRGLDSVVLTAIPVVVVDAGTGNSGDFAVCLAELEPGEKARALPRCNHRFHVKCRGAGRGRRGGEGGHRG
jgi:hypothetical protein